jgi:hypothetical protein
MITGVIKMALFWSEQMTQARQTTTPSVMTNCEIKEKFGIRETCQIMGCITVKACD